MTEKLTKTLISLIFSAILVSSLTACRTTVPEPSMAIHHDKYEKASYRMHNIAPQRASESQTIHFVDLNLDGHLDLLIGGNERIDGFHIEWGDSTGNWTLQGGPTTSMQPRAFATADINHNGLVDILIGGQGDQKGLQIWELDPTTQDWNLISSPIEAGIYHAVKLADINNDGWDDIIAARSDSSIDGGIFVLLNDGDGQWLTGVGPIVEGVFTGLAVEDINNDGNLDIIASRRGGLGARQGKERLWKQVGGIQIWYGDSNSRWEPEVLPASSDAESIAIADINGDGRLDIFSGLYQKGITMWLNQNGEWKKEQVIDNGTWSDIRIGDLDSDGYRELIASSRVGQGLHVWSWRSGQFHSEDKLVPDFGIYLDIDLGDVLNNGTLAIAATRSGGGG